MVLGPPRWVYETKTTQNNVTFEYVFMLYDMVRTLPRLNAL